MNAKLRNVLDKEELLSKIKSLKTQGKSIVATNGCFDILHVGHLRCLEHSKSLGDFLVVGLNSDSSVKQLKGDTRPINKEQDRQELLLGLKPVDAVVVFDELTASSFLEQIKPDIYTKGGDYSQEDIKNWPEYKTAQELGCKIKLIDFVNGKSSTKIIESL
jgi:D-glycero-beta-D-manno-heptose 1-phosphate adenylyltransferase